MARKRITISYKEYRDKFYKEKNRANIKAGVRVLSYDQFRKARKEGITTNQMLKAQKIFTTKAREKEVWKLYLKLRKDYQRGESIALEGGYQGLLESSKGGPSKATVDRLEDESVLGYHYNLSGLMRDGNALHALIMFEIDIGQDRKEVLADYGY